MTDNVIETGARSAGKVTIDDTVAFSSTAGKVKSIASHYQSERITFPVVTETIDTLQLQAHGINIFQTFKAAFFRDYMSYTYGGSNIITPEDAGAMMLNLNMHEFKRCLPLSAYVSGCGEIVRAPSVCVPLSMLVHICEITQLKCCSEYCHNSGKLLITLDTTCWLETANNTRANSPGHSNNARDWITDSPSVARWTIRSQALNVMIVQSWRMGKVQRPNSDWCYCVTLSLAETMFQRRLRLERVRREDPVFASTSKRVALKLWPADAERRVIAVGPTSGSNYHSPKRMLPSAAFTLVRTSRADTST